MPYGETSADSIRDTEVGTVQQPEGDLLHPHYQAMMRSRKDKRRAQNRVARASRRRNRRA
jgi:hypothetical protein